MIILMARRAPINHSNIIGSNLLGTRIVVEWAKGGRSGTCMFIHHLYSSSFQSCWIALLTLLFTARREGGMKIIHYIDIAHNILCLRAEAFNQ